MNNEHPSTIIAPLLSCTNLHKTYRMGDEELRVLGGVDVAVNQGEWLAILGASGSGKSTLLHLLGGLDRPDEGTVTYETTNVFSLHGWRLDSYRNRHIGFVFQFYHLLPELTAMENVLMASMIQHSIFKWPGARSAQRQRATELLDRMGLSARLKHKPNKLSGGERQRVAIARALMNKPAVLLADEPTGNLDAKTGSQILELFQGLHAQGQTIIMVTHDVNVAAAADRRLTLVAGRLQPQ